MSTTPQARRQDLLQAFDALLQPARFKDYGPNGLQVEGRAQIR
ncbi:MAG: Nif3-like dinuclear metal center hexameric protein, partial [Polaromonas sp.]